MPTLTLFGRTFSTYWMMFVVGFVGMAVLCCYRSKMYRLSNLKAFFFTCLVAVTGLVGTKLLFVLENWRETFENGIRLGGLSFFGALFLVPFVIPIFSHAFGLRALESLDLCAPMGIFILMCMRLGCMMNGCCGGILFLGSRIPTQFIESIVDAGILTYLLYIEKIPNKRDMLYPHLMVLYGIARFIIEFVRETPKDWLGLSHGQWFSLIAIFISLCWLSVIKARRHHD